MPNFTARFSSGTSLEYWDDAPIADSYNRTNAVTGHPHRHVVGAVGVQIELRAMVGFLDAPDDTDLGGKLFTVWWAEALAAFAFSYPVGGRSSQVRFTPPLAGHYVIGMRREDGGAVLLHLTVR